MFTARITRHIVAGFTVDRIVKKEISAETLTGILLQIEVYKQVEAEILEIHIVREVKNV